MTAIQNTSHKTFFFVSHVVLMGARKRSENQTRFFAQISVFTTIHIKNRKLYLRNLSLLPQFNAKFHAFNLINRKTL